MIVASSHGGNRNDIDSRWGPLQIAIPKRDFVSVVIVCNGSSSTLSQTLILSLQCLVFLLNLLHTLFQRLQLSLLSLHLFLKLSKTMYH